MLDVSTMFFGMIATSIVLAASLWIAVGPRFQSGLGKWTLALFMQAIMFALLVTRGFIADYLSIVLANTILALCIYLYATAMLEFSGRRLSSWWCALPVMAMLFCFSMLMQEFVARNIFHGIVYGSGFLALAVIANRLHDPEWRGEQRNERHAARLLMTGGFLFAALALYARAVSLLVDQHSFTNLMTPNLVLSIGYFTANALILMTSFGFLVLHKDRAEQAAQHLAMTDPLTGTFNRRIFLELAEKEIARSRRSGSPMSIIMLDLDHFKTVNDQHGHLAGDAVLKQFVQVVLDCLRREDLLVRYGGEEFCVLLPEVAIDRAQVMAERIRHKVGRTNFLHPAGAGTPPIRVTVSGGVASLARDSGQDQLTAMDVDDKANVDAQAVLHLVGVADNMLYAAKAAGRNLVVAYPENSTFAMIRRSHTTSAHEPTGIF